MYPVWIHVFFVCASQQNEYYGQDFASFPLSALQDWAQHQQQPQAHASTEALTAGCEGFTIFNMLKHVTCHSD
jgi:hypothetical protein